MGRAKRTLWKEKSVLRAESEEERMNAGLRHDAGGLVNSVTKLEVWEIGVIKRNTTKPVVSVRPHSG